MPTTRRATFICAFAALATLAACGSKVKGKYANSTGAMELDFRNGKVYMSALGATVQSDYEVNGNEVIVKGPQGNMVLTRNDDGSLSGPGGDLRPVED